MNKQIFSLQPFPSTEILPNLNITGDIVRNNHQLAINYQLLGNLKEIAIAPSSTTPMRKHELWQDTCFEFFVCIKDSQRYWEFNLSPAGHWNVYRFDGYRQGMQEEKILTILPFCAKQQLDSLAITLDMDLSKIILADQAIVVGITTVIKCTNGEVTYWALTHQGVEADFHLRESFIITL
ncbi:DOMON-like domain-containing protein [Halotia branconii]|uniref:DOMON-like domain-containing protein n=1 Tax=Halotia branconii CENA392 TaxID=1539056 RepID=A0AAJ6NR82_9CYAN|nr:DOMON-like domain-containing protein [Halotia branconii]WGV25225.1 DOMON-like domain-containing protein [Halotia branconii CENA392]